MIAKIPFHIVKNYLITITIILFFTIYSFSQKEDNVWLFSDEPYDVSDPIKAADTTRGATNMDFNFDPVRIYYDPLRFWDFAGGNSSLCNKDGELIAYSNGQVIIGENNIVIEDTINYNYNIPKNCNEWEVNNLGNNNFAIPTGLLGWQRVIFLPIKEKVYCVYNSYNYCNLNVQKMLYSTMEYNENDVLSLKNKDQLVINDTLSSPLYAIRHGNGVDWWLITLNLELTELLVFLVDTNGIKLKNKQKIREPNSFKEGIGQIVSSPDGKYLAWFNSFVTGPTGGGFCVADFNRCDGSVSNLKTKTLNQPNIGSGSAFSSDSRFLYVCNSDFIYQYDMTNIDVIQTEKIVAEFDGFRYYFADDTIQPNPIGYRVNFCLMKLGPDGKIYIFPSTTANRYISVINNPTKNGISCDVRQHSILMNTSFTRTVPNLPEFRLGPLDGSGCDTLGIDNHPIAKYRYEADTLDHLRIRFTDLSYFRPESWSWDFGDGSALSSIRHPWHTYTKNGTYKVCLTVSNENSSNTTCRTLTLGKSSTTEDIGSKADIHLFPNPVTDLLLITIGDYIPEHGQAQLFDIKGQMVHKQRVFYGHNTLDMTRLPAGIYICRILDGQHLIRDMKVVKVE